MVRRVCLCNAGILCSAVFYLCGTTEKGLQLHGEWFALDLRKMEKWLQTHGKWFAVDLRKTEKWLQTHGKRFAMDLRKIGSNILILVSVVCLRSMVRCGLEKSGKASPNPWEMVCCGLENNPLKYLFFFSMRKKGVVPNHGKVASEKN